MAPVQQSIPLTLRINKFTDFKGTTHIVRVKHMVKCLAGSGSIGTRLERIVA